MKKLVLGCLVGVAGVLSACSSSSDPCTTFNADSTKLATLAAPCAPPADGGTVVDAGSPPTVAACQAAYNGASCTAADRTTIGTLSTNYDTCVGALAACTTATASTFQTAEAACFAPIVQVALANGDAGVGAACLTALQGAGI